MKRKSTYILLLLICFVVSLMAVPVHAASAEGTYGNNIHWHFDSDTGTLTISGTGTVTGLPYGTNEGYMQYLLEIRHIVIEEGFTAIGESAFNHFFYLESVHIADTVEDIGKDAFANNFNATQLHLGASVETIGENAFGTMEKLQELILPPSVRTIGVEAFALSGITELIIPEGVTELNRSSFRGNKNLTRVFIPASVTKIQCSVFRDCINLTDIHFAGTQEQWEAIDFQHKAGSHGGDTTILGNAIILSATKHYNQTSSWQEKTDDSATEPTEQTIPAEPVTQPAETNAETTPTAQTVPQDNTTNPAEMLPDTGNTQEEKPNIILWITVGAGIAALLIGGSTAIWFCLRKNKK